MASCSRSRRLSRQASIRALLGESDINRLLELILSEAKKLCNADGGTLYLRSEEKLKFVMLLNDSLKTAMAAPLASPYRFRRSIFTILRPGSRTTTRLRVTSRSRRRA